MEKGKLLDNFNDALDLRRDPHHDAWEMERHYLEDLEQMMPWHNYYLSKRPDWTASIESEERLVVRTIAYLMELREKNLKQFPDFYTAGHSRLTALYADLDQLPAEDLKNGKKLADVIRPYIKKQEPGPNPLAARTDWPKPKK